jgi:predicted nuclease with TOPRIM domain
MSSISSAGPAKTGQQSSGHAKAASQESPGGAMGDDKVINVNLSISEREAIIKQNGFRSQADVQKRLNDIKNERKQLRTQLDQFQKNFEETHKRKIRYTKDIVPVQNEFKRYKDLKVDIAKLEQIHKYMPK